MVLLSAPAPIGLLPRRLAWDVLQAVAAGAYADVALERVLRERDLKPSDRGLVTELAYGAIRQRRTLDAWLDRLGKVPAAKQPPKLRWLLHVGLYQLLLMERIPESAAVNTAVELAKTSKGLARLAPVVNGVLRAALRAREAGETLQQPNDAAARLAQAHSLPDWFTQLLITWRGEEGAAAVASSCNRVPDLDLRVNRLRCSPPQLQQDLAAAGISSEPIVDCPDGLRISGHSGDLRDWPGYSEGYWCVQDCSAQWIAPLLDPQPGDRILDACAAPGGKATHLAELVGDQAEIWAVDRSPGRLKRVAANAARLGLESIHALAADAANLLEERPQWRESFQRILIDAPCSGLGTLARHPDARWRVTPESIRGLLPQQQALLDGLVPLLVPAGALVYATCTIHPDENQAQVQALLKRHPMLRLEQESQLWPDQVSGGDGFYSALLRRV